MAKSAFWSNPSTAAVGVFSLEAAFRCTDSVALTQPTLPQNGRRDNLHVVPYAFRDFRWGRSLGEMDARVDWNHLQPSKTNALPTPFSFFHEDDKYIERRQHAQVKFYLQYIHFPCVCFLSTLILSNSDRISSVSLWRRRDLQRCVLACHWLAGVTGCGKCRECQVDLEVKQFDKPIISRIKRKKWRK